MAAWIERGPTGRPSGRAAWAVRRALAEDLGPAADRLLADLGLTRSGAPVPEEPRRPDVRSRGPGRDPRRWLRPGRPLSRAPGRG